MPGKSYQDILMPEKNVQENRNTISPLQPVVNYPSYMAPDWGGMSGKKNGGEAATQTQQTKTTVPPPTDYKGMFDLLNENYAKKNEDIAKREEALRRAKTFATIGDALSAFHTAYSNARGVQSMVPAGTSLSGKWRERYDNLQREKEENDQAYWQGYQRIQQMKDTADYHNRQQTRLEKETQIKEEKADAWASYYEAMENKNNEQAAYWRTKAEALERGMPLDEALKQARIAQSEAAAENSRASANKNNAQAEKYRSGDEGKTTTTSQTKTDSRGRTTTTETTQTVTPAGQSGKKSASNNTPPSRQSAKKNVVTAPDDNIPPSRRGKK